MHEMCISSQFKFFLRYLLKGWAFLLFVLSCLPWFYCLIFFLVRSFQKYFSVSLKLEILMSTWWLMSPQCWCYFSSKADSFYYSWKSNRCIQSQPGKHLTMTHFLNTMRKESWLHLICLFFQGYQRTSWCNSCWDCVTWWIPCKCRWHFRNWRRKSWGAHLTSILIVLDIFLINMR